MMWVIVAAVIGFILGAVLTWGYMVNQIDNMDMPPIDEQRTEAVLSADTPSYAYNPASRRVEKR